jgi:hypothetical protein
MEIILFLIAIPLLLWVIKPFKRKSLYPPELEGCSITYCGEDKSTKEGFDISIEEDRKVDLEKTYGSLPIEEILLNNMLQNNEKYFLLTEIHGYAPDESRELIETAEKEAKKARLKKIKIKISRKAQELYSNIPVDDERQPIPDDVKMFVWNRDKGRCVNCGSQENLEFDHIIPISKGGSNTERNLQLLCEKCNRSKRDDIG